MEEETKSFIAQWLNADSKEDPHDSVMDAVRTATKQDVLDEGLLKKLLLGLATKPVNEQ